MLEFHGRWFSAVSRLKSGLRGLEGMTKLGPGTWNPTLKAL